MSFDNLQTVNDDTLEINKLIEMVEDQETHRTAMTRIEQFSEHEFPLFIPSVFYLIWSTPVYKNQTLLIDFILSNTPIVFHSLLFKYVVLHFEEIETDRKDKFFYFLKKIFLNLEIKNENFANSKNTAESITFAYVLGIKNEEVLGFLLS